MIAPLALAIAIVALGAAFVVVAWSVRGTYRWLRIAPTLAVLETALVVQAAVDVAVWVAGHRPGEPTTHAAYLALSPLIVPVVAAAGAREDGRWAGALLACGMLVVAVLVVRMQATWRHG